MPNIWHSSSLLGSLIIGISLAVHSCKPLLVLYPLLEVFYLRSPAKYYYLVVNGFLYLVLVTINQIIATKNQELIPNNLQHMNRENRRSRRQIFGTLANYIQQSTRPFSKSQLIAIDINPETAENYIKCFEIDQNTPKIIILRTGTRTSIGKKSYPKVSSNKIRYKTPRSMVKIFQDVSNYIKNASKSFHKSDLSEIGLDTRTAAIYIDYFEIVQNTPRILVQRPGKSVIIGRSPGFMED